MESVLVALMNLVKASIGVSAPTVTAKMRPQGTWSELIVELEPVAGARSVKCKSIDILFSLMAFKSDLL